MPSVSPRPRPNVCRSGSALPGPIRDEHEGRDQDDHPAEEDARARLARGRAAPQTTESAPMSTKPRPPSRCVTVHERSLVRVHGVRMPAKKLLRVLGRKLPMATYSRPTRIATTRPMSKAGPERHGDGDDVDDGQDDHGPCPGRQVEATRARQVRTTRLDRGDDREDDREDGRDGRADEERDPLRGPAVGLAVEAPVDRHAGAIRDLRPCPGRKREHDEDGDAADDDGGTAIHDASPSGGAWASGRFGLILKASMRASIASSKHADVEVVPDRRALPIRRDQVRILQDGEVARHGRPRKVEL